MKKIFSTVLIALVLIGVSVSTVTSGQSPWWQRPMLAPVATEDHPWGGDNTGGGDDGAPAVRPGGQRIFVHAILIDFYFRYFSGGPSTAYRLSERRTQVSDLNRNLPTSNNTTPTTTSTGNGTGN